MFLWSRNDVINMHQRRYTAPELREKLERHGFRVLQWSYNNFFIFPLAAGVILLRRGRAEPELASPHFDEKSYQVEMEPAPPLMNSVLTGVGKVETALMRHMSLPFGTSIIAIAGKTLTQAAVHQSNASNLPRSAAVWLPRTRTRLSSKMSSSVCVAPCWVVNPPQ